MRALKTILIIVVALVVLIAVLAMFGDSRFRVERTIVVAAPAAAVYANISSLEAMDKWGPWKEMEHNMTATMSGSPDGEVGAISHWKSDESEGEQELAELVPNDSVRTKLRFISPWKANNEGTFDLVAMGDSTKVTWGIQGENDFMGRVVALFMEMDKAVGPMLEKGLANLKSVTESEYAEVTPEYEIQTIDRPAMLYVGKRKVVGWADMKAFYGQQFGESMAAIGKAGVAPAGVPSGVYFEWNEEKKTADMLAGIPVPMDAKKKLKDLSLYETPAGRALLIEYYGGYSGLGPAHEAMDAYMKANKLEFNVNVVEEYLTDPGSEPDSSRWRTNVIYLIK